MSISKIMVVGLVWVMTWCGGCTVEKQRFSWDQPFENDEQLLVLLRRPENQPVTIWMDVDGGSIDKTGAGWGGVGLEYRDSPTHFFERQLREGRLAENPLLLLKLFKSRDPGTVLTGLRPFHWTGGIMQRLTTEQRTQVAAAIREDLLKHWDARVRGAVIQSLAAAKLLDVEDLAMGLADHAVSVRIITGDWMSYESLYHEQAAMDEGGTFTLARTQLTIKLIPLLIGHLNDPQFMVRQKCSLLLRDVVERHTNDATWQQKIKASPLKDRDHFDWIRASWADREARKGQWQQWWKVVGEPELADVMQAGN